AESRPASRERRPQAEILIERVGVDDLSRIHLPVRIPDRLELAERLNDLRAEHPRQQLPARLTVAMFAGERAAVSMYQIGGVLHERSECRHAFSRVEIEADAAVHATLSEVAE